MIRELSLPFVLGAVLAGGLAFSQDAASQDPLGDDSLEGRVQRLERDLAATEAELAAVREELFATRALLDETVAYQVARAQDAAAMEAVFARSEELGFTWGENYESREVLLAGFRAFMTAQTQGLPGEPAQAAAEEEAAQAQQRGGRRP